MTCFDLSVYCSTVLSCYDPFTESTLVWYKTLPDWTKLHCITGLLDRIRILINRAESHGKSIIIDADAGIQKPCSYALQSNTINIKSPSATLLQLPVLADIGSNVALMTSPQKESHPQASFSM